MGAAASEHASAPASVEGAILAHRFRFTDREDTLVAALYALAADWLCPDAKTAPAITAPQSVPPVPEDAPPLDPLDIVQLEVRLPPLPATMLELQDVLQRRNVTANQIADVISKDPGLTAWLLKLVNSPYYGFTAKIATIPRAVSLVGTRQIQTLAVGGALNSLAVLLPKGILNMEQFWRHSIAVGVIAQELWRLSGRAEPEQLFVSGLLHDCGKLALAYAAPETVREMNVRMTYEAGPDYVEEQRLLGFDHTRLGGMLLHRWNMPLPLVIAVLRHHHVDDPVRYPEAAAVHVADAMALALGLYTDPSAPVPPISQAAWQVLGLDPSCLAGVADVLRSKIDDMCQALGG